MAEYAGLLEKIYEDSGTNAQGKPYVKMSFKVAGQPKAFGSFLNKKNEAMFKSVAEGDMVRVTTVMNGKYENLDSITRIKAEGVKAVPAADPVPEKAGTLAPARPVPLNTADSNVNVVRTPSFSEEKDFRITYLACRRDAIELVNALVAAGALSLGTKAADKADNFYKAVQRYALAFAFDSWNVRSSDAAQLDTGGVEEVPKAAKAAPKYEE